MARLGLSVAVAVRSSNTSPSDSAGETSARPLRLLCVIYIGSPRIEGRSCLASSACASCQQSKRIIPPNVGGESSRLRTLTRADAPIRFIFRSGALDASCRGVLIYGMTCGFGKMCLKAEQPACDVRRVHEGTWRDSAIYTHRQRGRSVAVVNSFAYTTAVARCPRTPAR